jgi:hypothetical protein
MNLQKIPILLLATITTNTKLQKVIETCSQTVSPSNSLPPNFVFSSFHKLSHAPKLPHLYQSFHLNFPVGHFFLISSPSNYFFAAPLPLLFKTSLILYRMPIKNEINRKSVWEKGKQIDRMAVVGINEEEKLKKEENVNRNHKGRSCLRRCRMTEESAIFGIHFQINPFPKKPSTNSFAFWIRVQEMIISKEEKNSPYHLSFDKNCYV